MKYFIKQFHLNYLLYLGIGLFLSACSSTPVATGVGTKKDGPPPQSVDVTSITDATPKFEAKSRYGNPESYVVGNRRYYTMESSQGYVAEGVASWYGSKFHGRRTSSWEIYNMYGMTAAHKSLPLPTYVEVTNLDNGKKIVVKVNDRGPFVDDRLIDLSYVAAAKLDIAHRGTGRVKVRAIDVKQGARAVAKEEAVASRIYLQVGAFSQHNNAEKLKKSLINKHFSNVHIHKNNSLYRVRIGPVDNDEILLKLAARIRPHINQQPHVIVD
ncbi:MAG: septal ring lytic transglycosylase RlpA family protein [Gammaproteobacteria bacterium]|nr:septal ring lytic transglycosylase RlpA family protein [Gammaproteobacteria bacterium]